MAALGGHGAECWIRDQGNEKRSPGPCVIAVGDGRVAVGAGMAFKIMVSPTTEVSDHRTAKEL